MSAGVREAKSSAPGEDSEAARFGSQVFLSGCESVASPVKLHEYGWEVGIWDLQETSAFPGSWELQNIPTWETQTRGAGAARCSPWQLLPITNVFMDFPAAIRLL